MSAARQLGFTAIGPTSGAVISACGLYRYRLWRRWGSGAHVTWIMLNPSTAGELDDDATIRKCVGFARRWGCDAIDVVNLFAWRATNPSDLGPLADPVGPDNDAHIEEAGRSAALVVVAWGRGAGVPVALIRSRAARVLELLVRHSVQCLGRADNGAPRHPLMLSYTSQLEPF